MARKKDTHQTDVVIYADDPLVGTLNEQFRGLHFFHGEDDAVFASETDGYAVQSSSEVGIRSAGVPSSKLSFKVWMSRGAVDQGGHGSGGKGIGLECPAYPEASAALEAYSTYYQAVGHIDISYCVYVRLLTDSGRD